MNVKASTNLGTLLQTPRNVSRVEMSWVLLPVPVKIASSGISMKGLFGSHIVMVRLYFQLANLRCISISMRIFRNDGNMLNSPIPIWTLKLSSNETRMLLGLESLWSPYVASLVQLPRGKRKQSNLSLMWLQLLSTPSLVQCFQGVQPTQCRP